MSTVETKLGMGVLARRTFREQIVEALRGSIISGGIRVPMWSTCP